MIWKKTYLTKGLAAKARLTSNDQGFEASGCQRPGGNNNDPKTRKLIRVTIDEDEPGETTDLVERLMGKKPELRFQYIQENARFVEELDVGPRHAPLWAIMFLAGINASLPR